MMPTRIISFQQVVLEADPNWQYLSRRPWVYEFSNGRRFQDPDPLYVPLPPDYLANDNGVLYLTGPAGYPTTTAGLQPGAIWSNGGAVSVVPGLTPPGVTNPFFVFPGIVSSQLLLLGGAQLAGAQQASGSGLLWNSGGLVCVS